MSSRIWTPPERRIQRAYSIPGLRTVAGVWPSGGGTPTGGAWPASGAWPSGGDWPDGGGGGAPPWNPADITSVTKYFWLKAALENVTLNSTTVSAWADTSGAGNHFSQGTAGQQPLWTASDAAFSGRPSIGGNGGKSLANSAGIYPGLPSVNPLFLWVIYNTGSGSGDSYLDMRGSVLLIARSATVGQGRPYAGVSVPGDTLPDNTTARTWAEVLGTASTNWKCKGFAPRTANVGNGAGAGATCTIASNVTTRYSELFASVGKPSELALLESYGIAEYGSGPFT